MHFHFISIPLVNKLVRRYRLQRMAGFVMETGDDVTDIVEETLSSSTSRFSNLTTIHVAPGRAVFAAYDRLLDNRTVAVKCRMCSRDRSDRYLHFRYIIFCAVLCCLVGRRGSAVERQSLASILSPSCARPVADG